MANISKQLKAEFLEAYPNANDKTLAEAAARAGVINGGIEQLRGLYAHELIENGYQNKVGEIFPAQKAALIEDYYRAQERSI